MVETGADQGRNYGASAYNLLQQELIAVRARLDRQISQLIRLNRLSNTLLADSHGQSVQEMFAEAIVDVLDIAIGAVWRLGSGSSEQESFAVCGIGIPEQSWAAAGVALEGQMAAQMEGRNRRRSVRLAPEHFALLPGPELEDVLLCRCVGRDGSCIGLVLAANSNTTAGMFDPISDETFEVLTLIAEKFAAHLDHEADRSLIDAQVHQLQESGQRLESVLKGTNDGWWDFDLVHNTTFVSPRWLQMMACPPGSQELEGNFWQQRIHAADRERFEWQFLQALSGAHESVESEIRLLRDDDLYLPVLVRGTIFRDEQGVPVRFSGSIFDLSERKRHEAHVHQLAFYDGLTELPNRRFLRERLETAISEAYRTGRLVSVLMMDLDRFKTLNDTRGHAAGDQLLCAVGERLRRHVRAHDTVARLGGDEFVVLLENLGQDVDLATQRAIEVAEKLLKAINDPFMIESGLTHHSASFGVAVLTQMGVSMDTLLQQADVALYEAKAAGRNTVRAFQDEMQQRVDRRSKLEAELRKGFREHQLAIAFQPQVTMEGTLYGVEALMRWQSPDQGWVSPADFIPIAQESGLIHPMGEWLLRQVCEQLHAWGPDLPPGFRVGVNLSDSEFLHPDFPERVIEVLAETGVDGSRLLFEITEDTVLSDLDFAANRMHRLRDHAIEFSLDDFGTGYSSFTYLRHLPVSELKVDCSFVRRFLSDPQDAAIVRAILTLGLSMNLRVVAEGVETLEQRRSLIKEGCRHFQGFLFGRPEIGFHPGRSPVCSLGKGP